jgi:transposase
VGTLTALAFVLTIEDPERFEDSRAVGAYLGLVPEKDQSGESDPQVRISKRGDRMPKEGFWLEAPTTCWGPSERIPTSADTAKRSQLVAARAPRNGQLWRWPANSQFCCIASG